MYQGYLEMGGGEIVNGPRAQGYATSAGCPMWWFRGDVCETLYDALDDSVYDYSNIDEAPWYDPSMPETLRFYGAYPLSIKGIDDSTRTASITEGIFDGGTVAGGRLATKAIRVQALLVARGMDALTAGNEWLTSALAPSACGSHGDACGQVDLCFFVDCPPPRGPGELDEDYEMDIVDLRRRMHNCSTISGPFEVQYMSRGEFHARIVEFTIVAANPHVYTMPRTIDIPAIVPIVLQDAPFNLVPYPSAELAGDPVQIGINFVSNPSLELDAAGWTHSADVVTGTDPDSRVTGGRNNELSAEGSWSYRARLLGDGTAAVGRSYLTIQNETDTPYNADERSSFTMWGALLNLGGATGTTLHALRATAEFYDGGGGSLGSVVIGEVTSGFGGHVFALKSSAIPAGTEMVRTRLRADVTWSSSATSGENADIRLFADALAVTVP